MIKNHKKLALNFILSIAYFLISAKPIGASEVQIASTLGPSYNLDGAILSLWWVMPFISILLSLALLPLIAPKIWHHHYGKITGFISFFMIVALCIYQPVPLVIYNILQTIVHHYLPFIILIATLYTISGNIAIHINAQPTPAINTLILLFGALIANIIGTTGAAILLIRPLINLNMTRRYKVHTIVFFIFIVCNIGGCVTPLGDPPLFLGFLNGISFFWVTKHLWLPCAMTISSLLIFYMIIDMVVLYNEKNNAFLDSHNSNNAYKISSTERSLIKITKPFVSVEGKLQFISIAVLIGIIITSAIWQTHVTFQILTVTVHLNDIVRDLGTLILCGLSYKFGNPQIRQHNQFNWQPVLEICRLFAAIFITAIPVMAILQAGHRGVLHSLVDLLNPQGQHYVLGYFWLCGLLSAFLDNAPTYLIFFNLAGGDGQLLMTQGAPTLTAISMGAVFMGAMSYIGNAPNFMVKSIAESQGIKMPSFFSYLMWSVGILMPLFVILTWIMF